MATNLLLVVECAHCDDTPVQPQHFMQRVRWMRSGHMAEMPDCPDTLSNIEQHISLDVHV